VSIKKQSLRNELKRKFDFQEVPGSKHEAIAFFYGGKKIATTRFSRGSGKDLDNDILKLIAREVRVDKLSNLKEMIDCTKSQEDFLDILREKKFL